MIAPRIEVALIRLIRMARRNADQGEVARLLRDGAEMVDEMDRAEAAAGKTATHPAYTCSRC